MAVVANISCLHKVLLYPVYMNFMMFIISISFEMLFMITKVMMICIMSLNKFTIIEVAMIVVWIFMFMIVVMSIKGLIMIIIILMMLMMSAWIWLVDNVW